MSAPLGGFVALLRAAGLPIGSERHLLAEQALALVGLRERSRLHAALRASLCCTPEALPLFDAAFDLYWRAPHARLQDLLPDLPAAAVLKPRRPAQAGPPRRLLDAITPPHAWRPAELPPVQARLGASAADAGRTGTLEEASALELRAARERARALLRALKQPAPGRRWQRSSRGELDIGAALRRLQGGHPLLPLPRRRLREPAAQWLWLLDASGSMQEPLRELLLWAHAQARQAGVQPSWRFWAFAGSRLLTLTPLLRRQADADAALCQLAEAGLTGNGGTRIGLALQQLWAQEAARLRAGPCTLLLFSDGLDHAPDDPLLLQMLERWRRRGVRLLWLDPLQREHLGASAALAAGAERWSLSDLRS